MLALDTVPAVAFDPAVTTTMCDPYLVLRPDAGVEDRIACADGIVLGAGAIRTETQAPFSRVYLSRPACAALECVEAAVASADVTAWAADGSAAWHATITAAPDGTQAVSVGIRGAAATWPTGPGSAPAVERPEIARAPSAIAKRTPLPYCGATEYQDDPIAWTCFLSAVLAGQPAELIEHASGTEGGAIVFLYRFEGRGAVVEYEGSEGVWHMSPGTVIPNGDGATFSFEQWSPGVVRVTDTPAPTFDRDGWGDVHAAPPAWWTVPAGALQIASDIRTLYYLVPDAPAVAISYVTGLVDGRGFSAEGRETAPGYEQARFTDGTTTCSVNVVARGAAGGSLVEVLYPVGCPWP
jgi:hypothetical protein